MHSLREFRVIKDWSLFLGGFIALQQDLSDVDVREDLKQLVQETVACAHDGYSDEIVFVSLEFSRIVVAARRFTSHFSDFLRVQSRFDEHAHDSVSVVSELSGRSGLIADFRVDELCLCDW